MGKHLIIAVVIIVVVFVLGGMLRLFSPDTTALIAMLAAILYVLLSRAQAAA